MNSKRRDINKKGVTYQGDIGPVTAGAGVQLNADDDGEEDLVMVDGQGDHYEDDDGTEGEEALELDAADDEEDDEEEAGDEQGVPTGDRPKPKTRDRRRVVPEGDADMRLDRWLKLQLPHLPNSLFQKLLRKRKIRVVGAAEQVVDEEGDAPTSSKRTAKLDGKRQLQVGDVITYPAYLDTLKLDAKPRIKREMNPLSEEDTKLAQSWVIYKDSRLIALNKPPGLPVQGGSDVGDNHLGRFLSALKFDKEEVPRLVHRLDKECSGVLIMGRSRADAAHFTSLFKNKHVTKQYWAVLAGVPNPRSGRLAVPLKELGQGMGVAANMQDEGAKMAVTRYETRADATNEVSFVELWPWTGRKHQLRVHCAEVLKAPILGDDKYGSREAFDRFELMLDNIDNLHLHCRSLEIPHPIKENQRLRIVAAPPTYFRRTMDTFEFSEHDAPLPPARVTSTAGLKKKAQKEAKKAEREAQNRNKKARSAEAAAAKGKQKKKESKPKKLHIK